MSHSRAQQYLEPVMTDQDALLVRRASPPRDSNYSAMSSSRGSSGSSGGLAVNIITRRLAAVLAWRRASLLPITTAMVFAFALFVTLLAPITLELSSLVMLHNAQNVYVTATTTTTMTTMTTASSVAGRDDNSPRAAVAASPLPALLLLLVPQVDASIGFVHACVGANCFRRSTPHSDAQTLLPSEDVVAQYTARAPAVRKAYHDVYAQFIVGYDMAESCGGASHGRLRSTTLFAAAAMVLTLLSSLACAIAAAVLYALLTRTDVLRGLTYEDGNDDTVNASSAATAATTVTAVPLVVNNSSNNNASSPSSSGGGGVGSDVAAAAAASPVVKAVDGSLAAHNDNNNNTVATPASATVATTTTTNATPRSATTSPARRHVTVASVNDNDNNNDGSIAAMTTSTTSMATTTTMTRGRRTRRRAPPATTTTRVGVKREDAAYFLRETRLHLRHERGLVWAVFATATCALAWSFCAMLITILLVARLMRCGASVCGAYTSAMQSLADALVHTTTTTAVVGATNRSTTVDAAAAVAPVTSSTGVRATCRRGASYALVMVVFACAAVAWLMALLLFVRFRRSRRTAALRSCQAVLQDMQSPFVSPQREVRALWERRSEPVHTGVSAAVARTTSRHRSPHHHGNNNIKNSSSSSGNGGGDVTHTQRGSRPAHHHRHHRRRHNDSGDTASHTDVTAVVVGSEVSEAPTTTTTTTATTTATSHNDNNNNNHNDNNNNNNKDNNKDDNKKDDKNKHESYNSHKDGSGSTTATTATTLVVVPAGTTATTPRVRTPLANPLHVLYKCTHAPRHSRQRRVGEDEHDDDGAPRRTRAATPSPPLPLPATATTTTAEDVTASDAEVCRNASLAVYSRAECDTASADECTATPMASQLVTANAVRDGGKRVCSDAECNVTAALAATAAADEVNASVVVTLLDVEHKSACAQSNGNDKGSSGSRHVHSENKSGNEANVRSDVDTTPRLVHAHSDLIQLSSPSKQQAWRTTPPPPAPPSVTH